MRIAKLSVGALLIGLLLPSIAQAQQLTGTVVSVGDGDTLRVQSGSEKTTLRLGCIDSPEKKQSYGTEAAAKLKQLLPKGQQVTYRVINTDRYGRTVAEIYSNGQLVNLQMVQAGLAVVYREYLKGCPQSAAALNQAEQQAKAQRLGLWSQPTVCLPKDFRQKKCI